MKAFPVVLLLAVAGCATPVADVAPPTVADLAAAPFEVVQDHDHADPALHAGIAGFDLLGWHNGFADDGSWPDGGGVNELALHVGEDGRKTAFLARGAPQGGFAVLDVTDPAAIRLLADFDAEPLADIDVSFDGRWVFASTQRSVPGASAAEAPDRHTPRGVYVVDAADPAAPRLESFHPLPANGPHTATYGEIDGAPYVFLQTYDLVNSPATGLVGALPPTQRVWITEFADEGGRHALRPVATYSVLEPERGAEVFPHDAALHRHEDGRWILSVAYWDGGLRLVDVSEPSAPQEIAAYDDFHPSTEVNLHDVKTFPVPLGGRHVTVTGPELPTSLEDGQLTFVDTTDPSAPTWLGAWSVPGDLVVDQPFIFSPHVFEATADGFVYIGHNHAGVWAVDARDPASPLTAGWFMPNATRPDWSGPVPQTWGVKWPGDGLLYVSDVATGLYVLRPTVT